MKNITLTENEYDCLKDVVSSLRVVSKHYPGLLNELKQELENADLVIKNHEFEI